MGSLKPLVGRDCGGNNQLVQLGRHVTGEGSSTNQLLHPVPKNAHQADNFAQEYLTGIQRNARVIPQNFDMHKLLHEIKHVQPPSIQQQQIAGPSSAAWTEEFLADGRIQRPLSNNDPWTKEFLSTVQNPTSTLDLAWEGASGSGGSASAIVPRTASNQWAGEFLSQAETSLNSSDTAAASWTKEYEDYTQSEKSKTDAQFWDRLEKEWGNLAADPEIDSSFLDDYEGIDAYQDYKFEQENPYSSQEDALERGREYFEKGDLANAVLMFESAVQQQPGNPEAWKYLGLTQGENEQEPAAIAALKKCLSIDGSNQEALFALATAYTNENMYNDAIMTLGRWLAEHPNYAAFAESGWKTGVAKPRVTSFIDTDYFNAVEAAYIRAAMSQSNGQVDPQLQNALGVMYNLSGNFERAVESLEAALRVKPDDPRVWNRLGATLANGNRSAEAVSAYSKALEMYPGYVRARYNLGISCLNLRSHVEAVDHLLSALSLQQGGLGPSRGAQMSEGIWNTLRVAAMNLNQDPSVPTSRTDLLQLVDQKNFQGFSEAFKKIKNSPLNPNHGDITSSVIN